jgi:DNA-binding CsgD family transcriptional regulator
VRRGRPPYPDVLTPREQEVLALLREGLTNEQIGVRLGISEHGAKYHVAEILSKLGVSSRQEAARWSQPQRVAPGIVGLLTRHAAVGALVVAGVGLIALAAGVLLMNERTGSATSSSQAQQEEETLPPPPGVDNGPIRCIAYVEVQSDEADIWTMNPDGSNKIQLTNDPGWEGAPAWSPDGRRIAFLTRTPGAGSNGPLWVMNADGSNRRQILDNTGGAGFVLWSPNGKKLAFHSSLRGNLNLFVIGADGNNFTQLTDDSRVNPVHAWSADSRSVVFSNFPGLYAVDVDGSNRRELLLFNRQFGDDGGVSPDLSAGLVSRAIDGQPGLQEVFLTALPISSEQSLFRTGAKSYLFSWSPDMTRVAFVQDVNDFQFIMVLAGSPFTMMRGVHGEGEASLRYGSLRWTSDGHWLAYEQQFSYGGGLSETRICAVNIDVESPTPECIQQAFNNQDGPSSPSLLLN